MARKSITELKDEEAALFNDNAAGEITAADLRTFITDLLDTIKPSFAILKTSVEQAVTFGVTDTPLVFEAVGLLDSPEWAATTSKVTRNIPAGVEVACTFTFQSDVLMPADTTLYFTLYVNGVATGYVTRIDSIKNDPQVVSAMLFGFSKAAGPVDYEIRVHANAAGKACTLYNALLTFENKVTR